MDIPNTYDTSHSNFNDDCSFITSSFSIQSRFIQAFVQPANMLQVILQVLFLFMQVCDVCVNFRIYHSQSKCELASGYLIKMAGLLYF